VEFVRRGRIYGEPGVDLQLLESHLAFRLPPDFTGRLATDERLKSFPPTVTFPVSFSFTSRALRYLRIG
jgi:hypothetical protein